MSRSRRCCYFKRNHCWLASCCAILTKEILLLEISHSICLTWTWRFCMRLLRAQTIVYFPKWSCHTSTMFCRGQKFEILFDTNRKTYKILCFNGALKRLSVHYMVKFHHLFKNTKNPLCPIYCANTITAQLVKLALILTLLNLMQINESFNFITRWIWLTLTKSRYFK